MTQAVSQYLAAAGEFNDKLPGEVSSNIVRNLAVRTMLVLFSYGLPENWTPDGKPVVPLPASMAFELANNIQQIVSGRVPTCVRHLQGTGRPPALPKQVHDIGWAVAYRKCCDRGLIKDPAPTKTVVKFFGVTDKAVRKWDQKHSNAEPEDFAPYARDDADTARMIAEELPKAGLRYRMEHGTDTTPRKRVDTRRRIKIKPP